jgi:hypothetical protein
MAILFGGSTKLTLDDYMYWVVEKLLLRAKGIRAYLRLLDS